LQGRRLRILLAVWLGSAALPLEGCTLGPKALERSHAPYYEAVRVVYEEQFLRNLVHVRYNEGPFVLNVASINAQFEVTTGVEARPFFVTDATTAFIQSFTRILPFAQLNGTDRPTLTLDPADESETMRQFLTPISAESLAFLTQTTMPISQTLRLWVERINGVPNGVALGNQPPRVVAEYSRFRRAMELLQAAQDAGLVAVTAETQFVEMGGPLPAASMTPTAMVEAAKNNLEYRSSGDGQNWSLVRKASRLVLTIQPSGLQSPEVFELVQLLNLVPGERRYEILVGGGGPADPLLVPSAPVRIMQVAPRSTAQVFAYLAQGVEVPAEHLECGQAPSFLDAEGRALAAGELTKGVFAVHCCKSLLQPAHAYVAVKYRDFWFYIDDRDQLSKTTLALMLELCRLDFGRQTQARPLITLPAGR
jgi:hypothetical protein